MTTQFHFPDLKQKHLVVTGTTRGIGRALLPIFLEQGLNLSIVGRGLDRLQKVRADLGVGEDRMMLFECDLSVPEQVSEVGRRILLSKWPVDAILNNAAIDPRETFQAGKSEFWQHVFQVNLFSAVELTRVLLPGLKESRQGRILFTGTVLSELGGACLTTYASSKGALEALTRALAHEMKGTGITVNCVVPGAIQVEKEAGEAAHDGTIIDWQCVPRRLDPADLAGITCLLLSQAGSAITGQCITVDGGILHPLAAPEFQGRNLDRS